MNRLLYTICAMFITIATARSNDLLLAAKGHSDYSIVLPAQPSPAEQQAAGILQQYFRMATGIQLTIHKGRSTARSIQLGHTPSLPPEGYLITVHGAHLVINGGAGKGVIYGVYTFIETFMHGRKWDSGPAHVPFTDTLQIPGNTRLQEAPAFRYREVYMPAAMDAEYLDWHKLQRFEDLWGLWGHSFEKLAPSHIYFKDHPEYYSLVNGERKPQQLCLSNEKVLELAIASLQKLMGQYPGMRYWSISPNDDPGYCECDRCSALDKEEGGPQGSLIHFVNAIAARFPGKLFTTLAYGYTARPTRRIKPAPNVYIMLSSIDAYRSQSLSISASAAPFRRHLEGWKERTDHLFVWDYCSQFTSYLGPFPDLQILQPSLQYLRQQGVSGVFEQGSGQTYSDMAELKTYLLAKLLWNPDTDINKLTAEFLRGYYGNAHTYIKTYLQILQDALVTQPALGIYGNPVNEHNTFLSPVYMDRYSTLLDKAEAAVETDTLRAQRVQRIRLSQEYAYLQQARFYGIEQYGVFEQDAAGQWKVKAGLPQRIRNFVTDCRRAGATELSEGGPSPGAYEQEWQQIFAAGVRPNKALHAGVQLQYPFAPEYPAKREGTLVDGSQGYNDFSYNWLCFYGHPLQAVIDLGKPVNMRSVSLRFLEDPRHWIFRPSAVTVLVSADNIHFRKLGAVKNEMPEEHYNIETPEYRFDNRYASSFRYIQVKAETWQALPSWRYRKNREPMIACDEVWVE